MNVFATAALRVAAHQYGFTDARLIPIRFTAGGLKAVFRVEAGGIAYVLKRYQPDYRNGADVTAIHEAQAHLSRQGIPVAAPLPNRDGQIVSREGGDGWVLYEWVDGIHPTPGQVTVRQADALGELLGEMHAHLAHWQTDWPGAEEFHAYPAEQQMAFYEELLHHAEAGSEAEDRQAVLTLRSNLRGLERMAGVAPRILAMRRQWVHGDPNEGNLFYRKDREGIQAVIDFDNIRRAPCGFDFMYSLCSCFPEPGPSRDAYARAYIRTAHPSATDLELYAPLRAYWELCDIWPINWRYLNPAAYDPGFRIEDPPASWRPERIEPTTDWLMTMAASAHEGV